MTDRHHHYWKRNLRMTSMLLGVWCVVSFVFSWFARELNQFRFIGPLGFYMGAQGAPIVYVAIVWYYARYMNKLDREYGVQEEEPERNAPPP